MSRYSILAAVLSLSCCAAPPREPAVASPAPPGPDPALVAAQIRAAEAQESLARAQEAKMREDKAAADLESARVAKEEADREEAVALSVRCAAERARVEAWETAEADRRAKREARIKARRAADARRTVPDPDDDDVIAVTVSNNQASGQIARGRDHVDPPRLSVPCGGQATMMAAPKGPRTFNAAH